MSINCEKLYFRFAPAFVRPSVGRVVSFTLPSLPFWVFVCVPELPAGDARQQTPSPGLRHPSLEEGAGKRCSECGAPVVATRSYAQRICFCSLTEQTAAA